MNFNPEPDYSIDQGTTPILVYDLHHEKRKTSAFSLTCNFDKQQRTTIDIENEKSSPPLVVHRYSTGKIQRTSIFEMKNLDLGYGVRDGGVKTVIKLNEEQTDQPITLLYFEQIPWYFRVFLHTLKITTIDDLRTEIKPGKNFK